MALVIKENIVCGTILGVWKKEEELDLLENIYPLSNKESELIDSYKNEERKKEFLTTRVLLTELMEGRFVIDHKESGKPFIIGSDFKISISHSRNFVAMLISKDKEVGIDVELVSDRVRKVRKRFLTKKEQVWCNDDEAMTMLWSAKESVFKIYESDLDFHKVETDKSDFEDDRGTFVVHVSDDSKIEDFFLSYWKIEDNVLVYTVKDCLPRR